MTDDAALLVDRFVSASSATDAHDSLEALFQALKSESIDPSTLWQDAAFLEALLEVLTTSSYKNVPLEEGPSLVCRIYQQLWKAEGASSVLLKEPSPGRLVQSLLDVVSDTQQTDYTRVLGLQILNHVCTKAPSTAQSQLLETPNGLHRLADIFSEENNDQVRNELLGGVSQVIGKWPSCAKIWVFGEVCDVLMNIAMQEGGLTKGNVLVGDSLQLVESLVSVDATLADLIWASPVVAPKLAALLDLRGGAEFLNPPKPTVSQSDDLDQILATGSSKEKKGETEQQVLPKLTFNEEDLVRKVLSILGFLLDNPDSRATIWKRHGPLCSLVWELALVSRPPAGTQPVCALPSARLQQVALETTAQYFHSHDIMKQHYGVDRLLYLVCTGGGSSSTRTWDEKLGLSQAALHVLRQTLPEDVAREILTHTLAPPMLSDDDNDDKPPSPTVVQKLLNTIFENMATASDEGDKHSMERCRINLLGALGAVSVFFKSPTDREVMLGISSTLVDTLLQTLEKQDDDIVRLALLRFACEWVVEAPTVVQAFLASSHSVVLSVLLGSTTSSVGTMVGFLLGLFMENISGQDEEKHGGWTKQSIMKLLSKRKRGISGYTTDLEKLKTVDLPWKACALEWQRFMKWYSSEVLAIRRCVVHELTSGGDDTKDDEDAATPGSNHTSTKSLNRLVSQQAAELEELRMALSEAKATIESQEGQLTVWKRRVESTPTQLDEMLTEYTSKNADMEKEVTSLQKQLQEKDTEVQSQLEARDAQIVQLQATIQDWQTRELESRQERDDLRSELQGLTSAYGTLEQEYNRRDGQSMQGTAASAPTGEAADARPAQQPEGEVSHQSSSSELATLRTENARLRSDAQAADDWMAMAVQRMNDIGGQNQTLQQEVATLQGHLQQAQLTGGIVAPVVTGITQEQLDEERQRREQVEQQLSEARAVSSRLETEISTLRQQLEENSVQIVDSTIVEELKRRLAEEENTRQELESKLQNAQTDTTTAMDSLGDSKSERERLERTVTSMEDELQGLRSEIAGLHEERDRLEKNADSKESLLSSKDAELAGLRQQLSESRESIGSDVDMKSQELVSLRERMQSLSDALKKTQKELDETASREREEIQKRDERIRELESTQNQVHSRDLPPSDATGFLGGGGGVTDSRDEEIKSLREANKAAQEWMAKAVEHHQMLSDQVAALTEDKVALTKEIAELQQSTSAASQSASDSSRGTIDQLERELSERTKEVTDLGAKIIKLESEVRIKETEMAGVQERISRCDQLQIEVDSLELAKDAEVEKTTLLEKELSGVVFEKEELSSQLESLRRDLDEKEQLVAASIGTQSDETESLKVLLRERDEEVDRLQEELENAKDAFADADQLRISLQNARDESARLRADLDKTQSSLASLKDKTASFEQLQAELQTLRDSSSKLDTDRELLEGSSADVDRLRDEIATTKRELDTLTGERDDLKNLASQLETQLSEFQEWANAAQQKIAELQSEKDAAEQGSKTSTDSVVKGVDNTIVDGLRDEIASAKLQLTTLTTERDTLKETVSEMESQLLEFQSWADAAQQKIAELENEKDSAEHESKTSTDSVVKGVDSTIVDSLRDEITSARLQLTTLTTERDTLKENVTEMESQLSEFQSWSDAAQQKIAELQSEKDAAEQELKTVESKEGSNTAAMEGLRGEIASAKIDLLTLTAERDTLKETVSEMESQLSEFQSWSDAARQKIAELESEKDAAEQELKTVESKEGSNTAAMEGLRGEIASAKIDLLTLTTERDTLKETVSEMESQLSEFQSWSDAARQKIAELESEKDAAEQELKTVESKEGSNTAAMEGLRGEIASAKIDLLTLTSERDTLKETVSEMESQLSEFQSWSDAARQKIAELESEKDAAEQELKTVESKEGSNTAAMEELRGEIASAKIDLLTLTTERDTLKETVSEMESQLSEFQSWSDAAQQKITGLESEKEALELEMKTVVESDKEAVADAMNGLRDEIASAKNDLATLTAERDALKETVSEMESQLSDFQSWSDAAQLKITELENEKEALELEMKAMVESDKQATADAMDGLRDEIASARSELASMTTERDTLKETASVMETQLSDFQSWSDAAQLKITELENEKEALELEMNAMVESEKEATADAMDGLRDEITSAKNDLASVTAERDTLKETVSVMETQLSDFQSWSDAAQLKITELESEKDAFEKEMETFKDSQKRAKDQLDSVREEMEFKSLELSKALEENNELKEANADLDLKLERAKLEGDNLYAKNSSLEQDVKVLETQFNDLLERANKADALVKDKEEALIVVEANAAELQAALETIQEESTGVIDEWKAQVQALEATIAELEGTLQQQQAEASDAVEQWSARWSELDALKSELETNLETLANERDELAESLQSERENGGKEVLALIEAERDTERAEWEAEKNQMQARIDEQNESLMASSQNVTAAKEELAQTRSTAEQAVDAWKNRVSELEDTVSTLEQDLADRRDEAAEAIAQWESHCSAVEARAEELENELQAVIKEKDEVKVSMERSLEPLGEQLENERGVRMNLEKENQTLVQQIDEIQTQSEDVIAQWTARVEELEHAVTMLEKELEEQQEEATKAISQWETSYSVLESKAVLLEDDLSRAAEEADRSMNDELRGRQEEILLLKKQVDSLQKELADHVASQEKISELESSLELERQSLKETQASLVNKQELVETLEADLSRLRQEVENNASETIAALEVERAAREAAERDLSTLQEKVSETEEAFASLCSKEDQIFSESSQSKEDSKRIRELLEEKESEWNTERESLVQERDDLKATVGELQEELRDASDALQACVTDEISEKATEVASQALRYQMERLRSQIERDQETCIRERNLRLAAENEVNSLKTDLANVLGIIDNSEDASARVQRITMHASEKMQRREREEMEEIRKALERALQELASAQAAERQALEDAASSRLQLSVCEQEVLAAKSDLAFLTQTLEESREAEASKAASLEYRISSLEDDREVLRQFHQDELENLRNELTHVSMEKDRILHSLKESEKKNAAIVFSTSIKGESDGSATPEAELSRLRIEKAQLLTAAAEEGSRSESRIREAVAAHVSSMEADIILERELRVAAEAAAEDIKFQMEELKAADRDDESREPSGGNMDDPRSELFLDELSAELKRFKEETRLLSAENEQLREELERANEESQAEIVTLTDKWRKAQAKAHMLESSDHFDAEVNVEVAKLRGSGGDGEHPRNWIVVHENDNPVQDGPPELSPVEVYDLIQQQKIAIQEERAMYLELLSEHDDLLALLAQQDLEKASLNAALSRVAGPDAVEAAMMDAEENAVKQFGKYLKLTS